MSKNSIDRLARLRALDHFRYWHSLDDERVCVLCDRTFSGCEVAVDGERLRCPTRNCPSGVHQWVYTGNPLVSETAYEDWWRALAQPWEQSAA